VVVLMAGRTALAHLDDHDPAPHSVEEAQAISVGDD
jgi:MFS transporter, ACDE family, multidrug resistance protein